CLRPGEAAIQSLTGLSAFRLTAGRLTATGDARVVTAPLIVEYGLTSRLTLAVQIPIVETRATVQAELNHTLGLANVGPNPALTNPSALAVNASLVAQLRDAATALQQRVASCTATPTQP